PPTPLGLPKPASSVMTSRTFGAPSGARMGATCSQSGSDPASVSFTTPWNGGRRIGSWVRSIDRSLMSLPLLQSVQGTAHGDAGRRHRGDVVPGSAPPRDASGGTPGDSAG